MRRFFRAAPTLLMIPSLARSAYLWGQDAQPIHAAFTVAFSLILTAHVMIRD